MAQAGAGLTKPYKAKTFGPSGWRYRIKVTRLLFKDLQSVDFLSTVQSRNHQATIFEKVHDQFMTRIQQKNHMNLWDDPIAASGQY
jgi:hypothetical protein